MVKKVNYNQTRQFFTEKELLVGLTPKLAHAEELFECGAIEISP